MRWEAGKVDEYRLFVATIRLRRYAWPAVPAMKQSVASGSLLTPKAALKNETKFVKYKGNEIQIRGFAAAAIPGQFSLD